MFQQKKMCQKLSYRWYHYRTEEKTNTQKPGQTIKNFSNGYTN